MITYFASTLPHLSPTSEPPMTEAAFLEAARAVLSPQDVAPLEALATGDGSDHPFVVAWRHFDTQFHNAVATARAAKLGADATHFLHAHAGWDVSAERAIAEAFQERDPLKRDDLLSLVRFRKADELAGPTPLTLASLLAYSVRLSLLALRARRNPEKGRTRRSAHLASLSADPFPIIE
ncbi:MAG: hypothetical protein FWF84_07045 [Kiritimatiellaeota bacterium]|nr:hypothetical protein [Kiritimatiellota bacterium]